MNRSHYNPTKFLQDTTPFTRILFTFIIVLLGGVFISLLGFLACRIFLGIGIAELPELLSKFEDPGNLSLLKLFQTLQTLGMFILPPFLVVWLMGEKILPYLKLQNRPGAFLVFMVCLMMLVAGPLIDWFALLNQHLVLPSWLSEVETWMHNSEDQANDITRAFLSDRNIGGLLENLFIVAVLPAIGEELLFRGLVQKLVKDLTRNAHWGIWLTAALFSALHLQFFGFIPRLLLGALFGYMLEWTGTLWLPVIAHFINNATGVLIFFFTGEGLDPSREEVALFSDSTFYWAIASALVLGVLLWYLQSHRVRLEHVHAVESQQGE